MFPARAWTQTTTQSRDERTNHKATTPPQYRVIILNLLPIEYEGCTGEYWPEVMAVWTKHNEVRTKMTAGQYSPVRLEQAKLVSSLLYGTRATLVLNLPAFENKKFATYDRFHGDGHKLCILTWVPSNNARSYLVCSSRSRSFWYGPRTLLQLYNAMIAWVWLM